VGFSDEKSKDEILTPPLDFGSYDKSQVKKSDFQKMSFKSRFSEIMLPLFLSLGKGEMKRGGVISIQ